MVQIKAEHSMISTQHFALSVKQVQLVLQERRDLSGAQKYEKFHTSERLKTDV